MRTLSTAGLALLALSGVARTQDYRLAERLPPETLAYLSVPSAPGLRRAVSELGLAQLFRTADGARLVAGVRGLVAQGLGQLDSETRALLDELLGVASDLRGEVAVALIDLDMDTGAPRFALSADFGERAASFRATLEKRLQSYGERGLALGAYELEGQPVGTVDLDGLELHHAFAGGAWVVSTGREHIAPLLGGALRTSLATEPSFAACASRVLPQGAVPVLHLHLGVATALERFGPMLPPEIGAAFEMLGLDAMGALAYGVSVEGGAVVERFRMHMPEGLGALAEIYDTEPVSHRPLRFVPANAFAYGAGRVRFDGLAKMYQRLFAQMLPGGQQEVDGFLDEFARRFGFRLETDFAGNLGRELAYYAAFPEGGGLLPEMALGLDLVDGPRFVEQLSQMISVAAEAGGARAELVAREYLGRRYWSLDVELPQNGVSIMPLRPCLFQHGNAAIFTLFPHHMKAVIERIEGGGAKPSLADEADFAQMHGRAPQGHASFLFFRTKGLIATAYNTLAPLAQSALREVAQRELGIEIDLIDLPSAANLSKHLVDVGGWSTIDEHGAESTLVSPCGVMPAFVLLGAGVGFFSARQAVYSRSEAVEELEFVPAEPMQEEEEWEIDEEGNLRRKRR